MSKRLLSIVLSCVFVLTLLAGCGQGTAGNNSGTSTNAPSQGNNSNATKQLSFAFLPNTQNNSFQSTMSDTFKRLCEENGIKYVCFDPDYDLNRQLNQMADAANQKFDVVFVIPVDSAGIRQGLEGFKQKGIPVINVDTAVVDADRELVVSLVTTDCYNAGVLLGQEMAKRHPDGAKIAILDFPENESCVDRVNGFLEGLGENRNKFQIVAQQNGKAALDVSEPIAADIIQANPDLDAFFCINDPSAMGAVAAIKAAGKEGIEVYSVDASPEGKAYLVDGWFTAVAAQVPIQEAEVAFQMALDLLEGKEVEKEVRLPSHLVTVEEAKDTAGQWQ